MDHLTNLLILGFFLFVLGFGSGLFHLLTYKQGNLSRWIYVCIIAMLIGMVIVFVTMFTTAPANHAGVGFFK
jgi:hypothetical protein